MQTVSDAPSIAGPGHNLASTTDILADRFKDLINEAEAIAQRANDARDALVGGKVATDEQSTTLISIGLDAGKLSKRIDAKRLDVTKPLRDEVSETNRFFDTISSRMDNVKSVFEQIVGAYDSAKREQAQREAAEQAKLAQEEAARKLEQAAASNHNIEGEIALQQAETAEHKAQVLANQAMTAGQGPTRTDAGTVSQRKVWTFRITDASKIDLNKLRPHFGIADIEKAIRLHIKANRDTAPLAGVEIFPDTKAQFRG